MPVALVSAGILCAIVGSILDGSGERWLVDPETNENVVVGTGHHSMFFVKIHWWGAILFVIAVVVFVQRTWGNGDV